MILGINLKAEYAYTGDFYKVTQIDSIQGDNSSSLQYIKDFIKKYDACIIVPSRESFPYSVGDIDTFNNFRNARTKFQHYEKSSHTTDLLENFIYQVGYMQGKLVTAETVETALKKLRGI